MARPLPSDSQNGTNGKTGSHPGVANHANGHPAAGNEGHEPNKSLDFSDEDRTRSHEAPAVSPSAHLAELEHVRAENAQLRALCQELEQALQEAAQQLRPDLEQQVREFESIVEEKNDMIRQLHQQLQELRASVEEAEAKAAKAPPSPPPPPILRPGETPSEAELLALSEELERERRQLQEDEKTLMDQMREMEVSMARERAEMARQRNDLQRLQSEIRHELERLERDGGVQSKIESLRSKLQDASSRRGAAPVPASGKSTPVPSQGNTSGKAGLMGRLFKRSTD